MVPLCNSLVTSILNSGSVSSAINTVMKEQRNPSDKSRLFLSAGLFRLEYVETVIINLDYIQNISLFGKLVKKSSRLKKPILIDFH